jgi:hypothetical protein
VDKRPRAPGCHGVVPPAAGVDLFCPDSGEAGGGLAGHQAGHATGPGAGGLWVMLLGARGSWLSGYRGYRLLEARRARRQTPGAAKGLLRRGTPTPARSPAVDRSGVPALLLAPVTPPLRREGPGAICCTRSSGGEFLHPFHAHLAPRLRRRGQAWKKRPETNRRVAIAFCQTACP